MASTICNRTGSAAEAETFSELRAAFLHRRWTRLPGARSEPGAAPGAPPGGGASADFTEEVAADVAAAGVATGAHDTAGESSMRFVLLLLYCGHDAAAAHVVVVVHVFVMLLWMLL